MLKKIIRKFIRDKQGTTALELALIAPVLTIILFGLIELGVAMFVNTVVEGGLRDASRVGLTGMQTDGVSRDQQIANIVNEASLGLVNLTSGDISALIYPSFGDIGMPEPYEDLDGNGQYTATAITVGGVDYPNGEPYQDINGSGSWEDDMGAAGLGGPGEIVLYTIRYNWNFLSGQIVPFMGGSIPMTASMVVRNEPF
ncbi:TadE/TadG family type IV pilus assembly protein [Sneathiella limimaris]|uniref:TadE/TadG family type IV pilus assembly protein n=1 Tax=Sneathiella limimaris TaxID=1964213 RepID=UPI00146C46CC|nr:TadE/TadG family type IV pilus assembly protein [Sneathiella limimaris]